MLLSLKGRIGNKICQVSGGCDDSLVYSLKNTFVYSDEVFYVTAGGAASSENPPYTPLTSVKCLFIYFFIIRYTLISVFD